MCARGSGYRVRVCVRVCVCVYVCVCVCVCVLKLTGRLEFVWWQRPSTRNETQDLNGTTGRLFIIARKGTVFVRQLLETRQTPPADDYFAKAETLLISWSASQELQAGATGACDVNCAVVAEKMPSESHCPTQRLVSICLCRACLEQKSVRQNGMPGYFKAGPPPWGYFSHLWS